VAPLAVIDERRRFATFLWIRRDVDGTAPE
jgi:hypothetical protein